MTTKDPTLAPREHELAELERQIATSSAIFDILTHGRRRRDTCWREINVSRVTRDVLRQSARYLELRGRLERDPNEPDLVRLIDDPEN